MKTFQQPLTAGEEAYYIRLLREGTVEESRQAREILVERNLRLVKTIASVAAVSDRLAGWHYLRHKFIGAMPQVCHSEERSDVGISQYLAG